MLLWPKQVAENLAYAVRPEAVVQLLGQIDCDAFALRATAAGRRQVVSAIYKAFSSLDIRYDVEIYDPNQRVQKIRSPGEILSSPKHGTCLDLSLVFAGACISYQLIPLIVLMKDHAFIMVDLHHSLEQHASPTRQNVEAFSAGLITDRAVLQSLLTSQQYLAVETTGFSKTEGLSKDVPEGVGRNGGILSFDNAVIAGEAQLQGHREFRCGLDLSIALYEWKLGDCARIPQWTMSGDVEFRTTPLDSMAITPAWFKCQVAHELGLIGDKYIPDVHTPSIADSFLDFVLNGDEFKERLQSDREYLFSQFNHFINDWTEVDLSRHCCPEHKDICEQYVSLSTDIYNGLEQYTIDLDHLITSFLEGSLDITQDFELRPLSIGDKILELYNVTRAHKQNQQQQCQLHSWAAQRLMDLAEGVYKQQRELDSFLLLSRQSELHIIGPANSGKTHTSAHLAAERIDMSLPAIFLRGIDFASSKSLRRNILEALNLEESFTWNGMLRALDNAAVNASQRIPVIIDSIHESESIEQWSRELLDIVADFEKHRHLVFVTTCRDEYEDVVWDSYAASRRIHINGFDRASLANAIEKYFEYYKIKPKLLSMDLSYFSEPIFLRIFCEAHNHDRVEIKEVELDVFSLLKVFEDYMLVVNQKVCALLETTPFSNYSREKLKAFGRCLWDVSARALLIEEARQVLDANTPVEWKKSYLRAFLDEGILYRTLSKQGDAIAFTYDLMAGFLIADELLSQPLAQLPKQELSDKLLQEHEEQRHPLHEDIMRALGIMLPERKDRQLYEVIEPSTKSAKHAVVHALYDVAPRYFTESSNQFIHAHWNDRTFRSSLIGYGRQFLASVGHHLNFAFWDQFLRKLNTVDRDCTWTEYIREFRTMVQPDQSSMLQQLQDWLSDNRSDPVLTLVAKYCMWLLTSTSHPIRDKATKTLFTVGLIAPKILWDLALSSFEIDDLYVRERMLAAAYGVAMRKEAERALLAADFGDYAKAVYKRVFHIDALYSTTHFLIREYARQTIELALVVQPSLSKSVDVEFIRPPYSSGGVRSWQSMPLTELCRVDNPSSPVGMDFEIYTMSLLHRNNDGPIHGFTEQIYWRMSNLGYDYTRFEPLDRKIAQSNQFEARAKIDRYGKKYSWIAFFELMGIQADRGALPKQYYRDRFFLPDIDPSFPGQALSDSTLGITNYVGMSPDLNVRDWINKSDEPAIIQLLYKHKFESLPGPWVLLGGTVSQEDSALQRGFFIYVMPICFQIRTDVSLPAIMGHALTWDFFSEVIPGPPEDSYTFAGEIPWAYTFPVNGQWRWEPDRFAPPKPDDIEVLRKPPFVPINEEPVNTRLLALIPVRRNNWEVQRSIENDDRHELVCCREVMQHLGLRLDPLSWNSYDPEGRLATMRIKNGMRWHASESALFIRQDLLDRFLSERDWQLVWGIRGLREQRVHGTLTRDPLGLVRGRFQGACLYKDLIRSVATDLAVRQLD